MFNRRSRNRPAEEVAAEKAERAALCLTCQCCGRAILANTGLIAHHGYQRPGEGWQTSSCMGARELPYEADRKVLGELITILQMRHNNMVSALMAVKIEVAPIEVEYCAGYDARHKPIYQAVSLTRATFDEARMWHGKWAKTLYGRDFDSFLAANIASRESGIRIVKQDIDECQRRYDAWKQLFTGFDYDTKEWVRA